MEERGRHGSQPGEPQPLYPRETKPVLHKDSTGDLTGAQKETLLLQTEVVVQNFFPKRLEGVGEPCPDWEGSVPEPPDLPPWESS